MKNRLKCAMAAAITSLVAFAGASSTLVWIEARYLERALRSRTSFPAAIVAKSAEDTLRVYGETEARRIVQGFDARTPELEIRWIEAISTPVGSAPLPSSEVEDLRRNEPVSRQDRDGSTYSTIVPFAHPSGSNRAILVQRSLEQQDNHLALLFLSLLFVSAGGATLAGFATYLLVDDHD